MAIKFRSRHPKRKQTPKDNHLLLGDPEESLHSFLLYTILLDITKCAKGCINIVCWAKNMTVFMIPKAVRR